jgi:peptide deformylase
VEVVPEQLKIVVYPNAVLKQPAVPVDAGDPTVRAVARRMIELMHEASGVGLAAPQVGLSWRMFVTNARDPDPVDRVFINPRLVRRGAWATEEEGCLSIPGLTVKVKRPEQARIEAVDLEGNAVAMEAEGFVARVSTA